jgi:hypothetical protein
MRQTLGEFLAAFLSKPRPEYRTFSTLTKTQLSSSLQPGDLLLVEGNSRISSAIKYLTQSTWSHVCIYIGQHDSLHPLLEADLMAGVTSVPLDKYEGFNLRICRAVSLTREDTQSIIDFVTSRLGHQYDKRNIIDLARYLLPTPPVPQRFRRSLLEFGSGDPTKAICSTLVAQAFQSIKYPILPLQENEIEHRFKLEESQARSPFVQYLSRRSKGLAKRHYSHFTPRDFDLSPYFEVIKPTISAGFNYKDIKWLDD